jgi:hypothetical protein
MSHSDFDVVTGPSISQRLASSPSQPIDSPANVAAAAAYTPQRDRRSKEKAAMTPDERAGGHNADQNLLDEGGAEGDAGRRRKMKGCRDG